MQRSGASAPAGSGSGGGGGASAAAVPPETDYARLLRETAAARAHHSRSGSGGDHSGGPVPPSSTHPASDFAKLRQQLQASEERRQQNQQQRAMPVPSAPAEEAAPPHWSAYPGAAAQKQPVPQPVERSLEMPMLYNADAILAAKLQAEEEERARNARGGSGAVSPAERTRRLVAEEADARLAREMQEAEEAAQRRVREDSRASAELAAREARESDAAEAARRHREQDEILRRDAELARRLQQEESEGHGSSPDSVGSSSHASISGPRSRSMQPGQPQGSFGDELGQDGVILIGDESDGSDGENERAMAEVHRRHQDANRLRQLQESADRMTGQSSSSASGVGHLERQPSARTREQIIRRLHGMQGSYPGLAGQRAASFRFRPDGRLVVGWEDEEEGGGSDAPGLSEGDEAAQRAAFEQFEREQAARQQRQQRGQDSPDADERKNDSSSSASSESSGGGGFWSGLGNMWNRHSANSRQGVPFPFSVMLDPAQVAEAVRESNSAAASGPSNSGGGGWSSSTGPGGVRVFRWSSGGGGGGGLGGLRGFGRGGQQAELDVDRMDYDDLLRLEEALGSVKPRVQAARPEHLDALPVWEFKKPKQNGANGAAAAPASSAAASSSSSSSSSSGPAAAASAAPSGDQSGAECAICMCEFEEGDAIKGLPCMHTFHAAEIDKWLRTNAACPICRVPVGGAP